jgi:photosystem II stability/assembly factor-like uncharacterized protein
MRARVALRFAAALILAIASVIPAMSSASAAAPSGTWARQTAPAAGNSDLQGVYFLNNSTGWAVGGTTDSNGSAVILYTTDGGTTWNTANITGGQNKLFAVHFVSSLVGFAVGDGGIFLTSTDGGQNWAHIANEPDVSGYADIQFGDATHGCAVGSDIVCTSDGGNTWATLNGANRPSCPGMEGISFGDAATAYVAGPCGVLKSTNANTANVSDIVFTKISDPPSPAVSVDDVSCADGTHCTVVGNDTNNVGVVAVTVNGTAFTTQTSCLDGMGLEAVDFRRGDALNGWIGGNHDTSDSGAGQLCQTSDAGASWPASLSTVAEVKDVWFTDVCHGWMVTETESQAAAGARGLGQPRAAVAPSDQLVIYAFTDTCPTSAEAPAGVGLPKAGHVPQVDAGLALLLLAAIAGATVLGISAGLAGRRR